MLLVLTFGSLFLKTSNGCTQEPTLATTDSKEITLPEGSGLIYENEDGTAELCLEAASGECTAMV